MKNIAVLGSSGSIGESTLRVIRSQRRYFRAACLSVNSDIETLEKQIREFRPFSVCVRDLAAAGRLAKRIGSRVKIYSGDKGLEELVKDKRIDRVMFAVSGSCGLNALLSAIESNKDIALANKETLVMAGQIIMRSAAKHKVKILPVDSEQSAIWQVLNGQPQTKIRAIYLTASGGPFRNVPQKKLRSVTIEDVLRHPRWRMGKKITVDSATLMNKGLELLEAMCLFNVSAFQVKVLIHPEAIIHSMVEFEDKVVLAQLAQTDMCLPIQYALSYPQRLANNFPGIDFYRLKKLSFGAPDIKKFPALGLAYQAALKMGSLPAVMNAANEESVESFLSKKIKFLVIPRIVEKVMRRHQVIRKPDLRQIIQADAWAREEARTIISALN